MGNSSNNSGFNTLVSLALVALLAIVAAKKWWTGPVAPSLPEGLQKLASVVEGAMPYDSRQQDAALLHGLMHGLASTLANDGRSDLYYVPDRATFMDRALAMGDLVVGPDWTMKDRYPQLPEIVAAHIGSLEEFPAGRQLAVTKLNELADVFEAVACD